MNHPAMNTSNNIEWGTPKDLFEALNIEFKFTLDPCASDLNHKCDKYFTIFDDGLSKDWSGNTVFCNPPYGKSETRNWVKKCYEESLKGVTSVMLIPARVDTRWFHDIVLPCAEIRFVRGRIKFDGAEHTAPFPSMIVIFRGDSNEVF